MTGINVNGVNYAEFVQSLSQPEKFHDEMIHPSQLTTALSWVSTQGARLDAIKKSLFYGRPHADFPPEHAENCRADQPDASYDVVPLDMLHGIVGLITEASELGELLMEAIESKQTIDPDKLALESGDLLWYLQLLCNSQNRSIDEVAFMNVVKLRKRFPDAKFTEQAAIARADEAPAVPA